MADEHVQCRRCADCRGQDHHYLEDFDDGEWEYSPEPRPVWACKHCDFVMPYETDDPNEDFATYHGVRRQRGHGAGESMP